MKDEALPSDGLPKVIAQLAGFLGSAGLSNGDRATLRRMHFSQPPPLTFYKVALTRLPPGWDAEQRLRDWVVMVSGMCLMYPTIHRSDQPLGVELAQAHYAEARLERLLASEGDTRRTLVLRLVRVLASRHTACDWNDVAGLLLTKDGDKIERLHRRIASHFYSNLIQ
jgi:CRISPR type I-E-associated protein CasB/Cse2